MGSFEEDKQKKYVQSAQNKVVDAQRELAKISKMTK